ncbi:hypothetical protein HRW23_03620 [Streptomyces lunaelactis]|uniref:hypothetical protein n=1 Tax=Streptomyces lunaelactis TaxID=1535768 RepID=UPI0015847E87|nr:hypothetical protein [Streptomyces lunaelactis]NUK02971.1 hypothetical protein [Streptomyces lunaelactis]NUK11114.1 hypothetical protein [Streptomyces lunaelactis]NUK18309.1 hypothetical protein [Streptomyces lunaelactis]NUK25271.1 hypothetical protein [Streptomyces lunaelactis]NUK37183.1 hypothetical protein [Streptomyces lunaelactis]
MKPMKVAAVVAGSLAAAAGAAPAFAASDLAPTSLNGTVETVVQQTNAAAEPLANEALGEGTEGLPLSIAQDATGNLSKAEGGAPGRLLGGLPLGS